MRDLLFTHLRRESEFAIEINKFFEVGADAMLTAAIKAWFIEAYRRGYITKKMLLSNRALFEKHGVYIVRGIKNIRNYDDCCLFVEDSYVEVNKCEVVSLGDDVYIDAHDSNIHVMGGSVLARGHCFVSAHNNTTVEAYDTTIASGSEVVHIDAYNETKIHLLNTATCIARDNTVVYAHNKSRVKAWDEAFVHAYDYAVVDYFNSEKFNSETLNV